MKTIIRFILGVLFFVFVFGGLVEIFRAANSTGSWVQWTLGIAFLIGATAIYRVWFREPRG